MGLIQRALRDRDTCSSAELAKPLLYFVGAHDRDNDHICVHSLKEGSANGIMSDKSGMSNTMNAVRFPSKPPKLHRFWLPALSSTLDQLADAPAFDGLVTGFDRQRDFGHDLHDYPSPGCGCAGSPLPPTPGSVERPLVGHRPLIGHLLSACPAAHTWVHSTPGYTIWTGLPIHDFLTPRHLCRRIYQRKLAYHLES
jgi:hypothetical protein